MNINPNPPHLTLTPSASDGDGGQVSMECRASSIGSGETLAGMSIQRVLFTNPNTGRVAIVGASAIVNGGQAALTSNAPQGADVSGSIGPTEIQKFIKLTLNRAKCGDAGTYYCLASTLEANFNYKNYKSLKNVTIKVSPGSITMTTEPCGTRYWRVNDTLLMRCNGTVGTVQDDSQLEWIWQYQDENRFPGAENWQPYSNIGDSSADIQTDPSIPTTNSCYKRQISVLTRHLTLDDTDREYRCYVVNNGMSGNPNAQANAQVISVGIVSESGVAPATQSTSSGSVTTTPVSTQTDKSKDDRLKTSDCPDVGVIIGAVVAALIVIDVAILAFVIIVLKRRMTQTKSKETRGNENQMSSLGNVSRPVEQGPDTTAENPKTYDGLIIGDMGVASLYQDLGSPYELSR